ncbi:hypothetical protein O6H91_13G065500 [Diphasiastrum complanatum]|uniref:Uncharacterized protein n=1 Tax=Diphasiastrum complanatum TaxID=34168 RepID=A0ACC2BVR6_DIPCM|nr:hypothetical protein O6H91_13G065500 [Diphasiastrum complanatum]
MEICKWQIILHLFNEVSWLKLGARFSQLFTNYCKECNSGMQFGCSSCRMMVLCATCCELTAEPHATRQASGQPQDSWICWLVGQLQLQSTSCLLFQHKYLVEGRRTNILWWWTSWLTYGIVALVTIHSMMTKYSSCIYRLEKEGHIVLGKPLTALSTILDKKSLIWLFLTNLKKLTFV